MSRALGSALISSKGRSNAYCFYKRKPQLRNECLKPILALISTVNGESIYGVKLKHMVSDFDTICFYYGIYNHGYGIHYTRLRYTLYTVTVYTIHGYGIHYIYILSPTVLQY
jgi:hypothetical protein